MLELLPPGFTFGVLDNGIVLVGMYLGIDLEEWISRKLNKKSNPLLGAVIGATTMNAVSDGVAALVDPSMDGMVFSIVLGCLSIMLLIPVIEKFRRKKKNESR